MRFLNYIKKDRRKVGDIIAGAVDKVHPVYSPLVGEEPEGDAEELLNKGLDVKPIDAEIREISLYA